jgi:hypothetical protein
MDEDLRVELPEDLANELIGMGFEEVIVFRGLSAEAGTVMTVASASLALGANMATIVVARKEIGEFVTAVRNWVRRKTAGSPEGEVSIDISARRGDEQTRAWVKIESKGGTPELDTAALTAFMISLLTDKAAESAAPAPD